MGDVVGGVTSMVGNVTGGLFDPFGQGALGKGRDAQIGSTWQANEVLKDSYNKQLGYLQPWNEAGLSALSQMQDPSFNKTFSMADFQEDPGYQFRMSEGMKALDRSAAAKGGLNSGAQMKAISRYGQDMASQEYQNAYNRFNSDQDRRFGRLSSLAGLGTNATGQMVNATGQYGSNLSNNMTGLGNAVGGNYAAVAQANQNQTKTIGNMAAMASDRNSKTNIRDADKEISAFLDGLKAFAYEYKEDLKGKSGYGHGEFISVMAQDLEKSDIGRSMVFEGEHGKMVDYAKGFGFMLAANVSLHERLKRLEEKEMKHAG